MVRRRSSGSQRAREAAAQIERLCEVRPRGLLEALLNGSAVAYGKFGGLQSPKTKIEASRWIGEWVFQTGSAEFAFAAGEIHDLTIMPKHASQQDVIVPVNEQKIEKQFSAVRLQELVDFFKVSSFNNREIAKKGAEEHFHMLIAVRLIWEARRRSGTAGKGGRPKTLKIRT